MSEKKLFTEFPPVPTEQWEETIKADLKGADYEKKLVWRTGEGFNVKPYYRAEDLQNLSYLNVLPGEFPFVRGNKKGQNLWEIRQEVKVSSAKEANATALDALAKGVDAVGFTISPKSKATEMDLDQLLKGIDLSKQPLYFEAGVNSAAILEYLAANGAVKGGVFFDPCGRLACSGTYFGQKSFPRQMLVELISASESMAECRVIGVDGSLFQNAGATLVQELAFSLAAGNEYLTQLTEAGFDAAKVAQKMAFRFAIGPNYFMEMAKFRAARLLWARIVDAWKPGSGSSAAMYIHGVTASWNMTQYDAHVNMLRTTTEAMSAALAGVDAISVLSFDAAFKVSDRFSERIARNQQIVLKEEAWLDKVADPAAGSYYIENLTHSMVEAAWPLFCKIDEMGGFLAALTSGFIQQQVGESAAGKRDALAKRKAILLGTNQYANTGETLLSRLEMPAIGVCCTFSEEALVKPIQPFRLAESFEALRLKTERSGKKPKVFLLTIGNLAMRKARAGFSLNFFAVAGFEIIDNNGFETINEGVEAAVKAGADIVVLCSSDDEYATYAPQAVEALRGKALFVLAGYPKEQVETLKAAGVENFIFAGQNVLSALESFQSKLGL